MNCEDFSEFISELSKKCRKIYKLETLLNQFLLKYDLTTIVGFELEFYLSNNLKLIAIFALTPEVTGRTSCGDV